jgi:DNA-binding PadR family transcriptional regulator
MNKRSKAILSFLSHGYWMTPSLIHENMQTVTWSYNTTLNRLEQLVDDGYVKTHSDTKGWYKITEEGAEEI